MTGPSAEGTPARPEDRPAALALASVHLRLGSLWLARAELEGLAGSAALDDVALVDLAEARWRTGDLPGAGEAASIALQAGRQDVTAYVIAAEAMAAAGRPGEARKLASRALELSDRPMSAIFAGQHRSSVWPIESSEPPPEPTALFDAVPVPSGTAGAEAGLWDEVLEEGVDLPEPAAALDAGREALDAGDARTAALRLGLVLRVAPALAPAVLELVDAAEGPELAIVRGDAYRLVGHERDARQAFAAAAAAIPTAPEGDPDDPSPRQPGDDPGPTADTRPDH